MAFDKVIWTIDTDEADRFFDYAGYKARNLRSPLQRAGGMLLHHINLTFESEGGEALQDWPPLSRGYAKQKLKMWGSRPMLVASGEMRSKAISRSRIRIADDELVYSMTSPAFAALHQQGGEFGISKGERDELGVLRVGRVYRRPPRRSFVVVTTSLVDQIEGAFIDWLDDLKHMNRARRDIDLPNPVFA